MKMAACLPTGLLRYDNYSKAFLSMSEIDFFFFIISGSIIAAGFIGFSRGCGIASMSVVTITLLDDARFPTGLGLIYGLIGFLTTVMGPVYGKYLIIITLFGLFENWVLNEYANHHVNKSL